MMKLKERSILLLMTFALMMMLVITINPRRVFAARKRQLVAVDTNQVDETVKQTAKKIKKGTTDINLNGLFGWCKFTAPKSKAYVFSFDMTSKTDTCAYVYFKAEDNSRVYGVTNLGVTNDYLWLCSPSHWAGYDDEIYDITENPSSFRPSNSIRIQMTKGQKVYIRVGSYERNARIRVNIGDKKKKKSNKAIRKLFKKSSIKRRIQKEIKWGKIQSIRVSGGESCIYDLVIAIKTGEFCEPLIYINPYTGYSCYNDHAGEMSSKHPAFYLW